MSTNELAIRGASAFYRDSDILLAMLHSLAACPPLTPPKLPKRLRLNSASLAAWKSAHPNLAGINWLTEPAALVRRWWIGAGDAYRSAKGDAELQGAILSLSWALGLSVENFDDAHLRALSSFARDAFGIGIRRFEQRLERLASAIALAVSKQSPDKMLTDPAAPLSEREQAVLAAIPYLPNARTGKDIIAIIVKDFPGVIQSSLTSDIIPKLKRAGNLIKNRTGALMALHTCQSMPANMWA